MRTALSFLLAMLVLTAPAVAQDAWTPDWKMIAGDGSVLPSDCIGSTETLDCFIDTLAACSAWSEGPEWRADDTYFDAPICAAVPSFKGLAVFNDFGPAATETHFYATERWTLAKPEDWLLYPDDWAVARAGDTVIDFFTLTCAPNRVCLAGQDLGAPASVLRAACPISDCSSGPALGQPFVSEGTADADAIYAIPDITLLMREDRGRWRVVAWYGGYYYGMNGARWYPDHWKRK